MEEQNPMNYGDAPRTRPTGITVLAALYVLAGLIMLAMPLMVTAMLAMMGMGGNGEMGAMIGIGTVCWVVFGILALIYFAIAYGLLKGQHWARIAAIIFAILSLFSIPIGTIIGIIVLWYLFKPDVKAWFQ